MTRGERGLAYCQGRLKRCMDLSLATLGLVLLAPLYLLIALAIMLSSGGPVLFRHERVGLHGRPFKVLKFRSMHDGGPAGLPLTGRDDPRVTRAGRFLRYSKLDELPQLINVVRGEMAIVGPRPEAPRYVARYTEEQRRILSVRPGLTDPATVLYRDEETLLGAVEVAHREKFYLRELMPKKLSLNLEYIERAGLAYDVLLILRTVKAILFLARI